MNHRTHIVEDTLYFQQQVKRLRQEADDIKEDFSLKWGQVTLTGVRSRFLTDLDTEHLENIIVTQAQITPLYKRTILAILKQRYNHSKK